MTTLLPSPDAAIMQRLVDPHRCGWTEQAARAVLQLSLSGEDRMRASELADKANEGSLTETQQSELESYLRVGAFVDLMQSKARLFLREVQAAA